jgi:hypothetical protein
MHLIGGEKIVTSLTQRTGQLFILSSISDAGFYESHQEVFERRVSIKNWGINGDKSFNGERSAIGKSERWLPFYAGLKKVLTATVMARYGV